MPTAYELLLGGNLSDVDRQKLLAQQLRNRRQTGELAILSGDKVLAPLGEGLFNEALQKEDAGLGIKADEVAAAEAARQYGLDYAFSERQQGETERHNRAMEEVGRLNAARLGAAQDRQFNSDVRRLSEKMTQYGVPELKQDINNVSTMLDKFGEGDIPGHGMTSMFPEALLSPEGVQFRQAVARVRNKLLKIRSGAAVTDPEMARLAEELGAKLNGTDREIRLAWPEVLAGVEAMESGILAGYDPEVVDTFSSRYNALQGGDPSSRQPAPAAAAPAPVSGGNRVKWSDL